MVDIFSKTPDPDYPGHSLLELYQAQMGAALRPAFTTDTPPHITAIACQVCSKWLACGVSGDVGDLSRVLSLLVTSLKKVHGTPEEANITYGEAVVTLESLAVLRAWAEVSGRVWCTWGCDRAHGSVDYILIQRNVFNSHFSPQWNVKYLNKLRISMVFTSVSITAIYQDYYS